MIWIRLLGLALLGMAAVGYQAALCAMQKSPANAWAGAGVCGCAAFDLDRGQVGLLRISQQSRIDMQKTIKSPTTDDHLEQGP